MKKNIILPVLIILFVIITGAQNLFSQTTVSVLYFTNTAGSEDLKWLEKGLADMLLTDLSLSDELQIVEREELEKIIEEQKFSLSGLADEDQSIEIGKLLSAEIILTGSFIAAGDTLRVDAKLLDSETGALKTAVKAEGPADRILEIENEIAKNIYTGLSLEIPEAIAAKKNAPVSAVQAYYQGMMLFDNKEYAAAVEYYKAAAIAAPEYEKPRAGLEESYKFLKDFKKMRYQREINTLLGEAETLRRRLAAGEWFTYGDFVMNAYKEGLTDHEEMNRQAEALGLFKGDTRAICTWNLQNILMETADLSREYFDDEIMASYAESEIIALAREARTLYARDAFLPEIIYQELLVSFYKDKWEETLVLCEELMLGYPEYRMMWAVEDFYEDALSNLDE